MLALAGAGAGGPPSSPPAELMVKPRASGHKVPSRPLGPADRTAAATKALRASSGQDKLVRDDPAGWLANTAPLRSASATCRQRESPYTSGVSLARLQTTALVGVPRGSSVTEHSGPHRWCRDVELTYPQAGRGTPKRTRSNGPPRPTECGSCSGCWLTRARTAFCLSWCDLARVGLGEQFQDFVSGEAQVAAAGAEAG